MEWSQHASISDEDIACDDEDDGSAFNSDLTISKVLVYMYSEALCFQIGCNEACKREEELL